MQTPFRSYLQDMLTLVKKENAECNALGALPPYHSISILYGVVLLNELNRSMGIMVLMC
ncbi:hypothetical protein Dsin_017123 [Dipteronia sinensis]|uniref:Uncharacterized protein n=1 Tax=Dipteronia sinensis TaxID=43782 RepID=A0AAE0AFQ5_9ROSI|nr:hypothetical protein Dsin_017123 [Dipteronia sinensis]